MARIVYVVYDSEMEKLVGVFDNPEAADECESAAPGDRYTETMDLLKRYVEEDDPRVFDETLDDVRETKVDFDADEVGADPYDDDQFYETDDDDKDPYGD